MCTADPWDVWAIPVPQLGAEAQAQKQELLPALSVVTTVQHLAREDIFTVENNRLDNPRDHC